MMNWYSNEYSHVFLTHNGVQIGEWEGEIGETSFILEEKGSHELLYHCI